MPSNSLAEAILGLASADSARRAEAGAQIYEAGKIMAERATQEWWNDRELAALVGGRQRVVTVGLAVSPEKFFRIREANGAPPLANVPPEQDAEEFEVHFDGGVQLDILTTREPGGEGAIARYLQKFGEGVQQVEYLCTDVDRVTEILKERFGVSPIYPQTRSGADGTRVNFFLVTSPGMGKVLIEFYERTSGKD